MSSICFNNSVNAVWKLIPLETPAVKDANVDYKLLCMRVAAVALFCFSTIAAMNTIVPFTCTVIAGSAVISVALRTLLSDHRLAQKITDNIFGKEAWQRDFGFRDVGEIPPIPEVALELARDGWKLQLMIVKADSRPLNIEFLGELITKTIGSALEYQDPAFKEKLKEKSLGDRNYWVVYRPLLAKSMESDTAKKTLAFVEKNVYRMPGILEVLTLVSTIGRESLLQSIFGTRCEDDAKTIVACKGLGERGLVLFEDKGQRIANTGVIGVLNVKI